MRASPIAAVTRIAVLVRGSIIAAALAAAVAPARAATEPLWELGLGAGVLALNDYRGADTTHLYVLPVPYFVYRGTLLKADHDGVRPDLRPTVEIGPQLTVHLWHSADQLLKLDLRVPARAAFTVQAVPQYAGDTLTGASFVASPLVQRDSYWSTGFAVTWIIRQSAQLVRSEE